MKTHTTVNALVASLWPYVIGDVVQFTRQTDPADRLDGQIGDVVGLYPDYVRVSLGDTYVDVRDPSWLDLVESADVLCAVCARLDGTHAFWCGDPFIGLD